MSSSNGTHPETEVSAPTRRRTFSAAYKRKIVEEAAACEHGEVGALLRREGLYASQLASWRKAHESGTLSDHRRGPRANPEAAEIKRLEQENARLLRKLAQAEAIIEAQKKLARLLENQTESERP